jgi:UDP-2,3-diacylglucosamine hydrolase
LLHGDELCQRDLPYQRAKRILRHPLTRGIARRLPLGVAIRLAEKARIRSGKVMATGDQTRFDPVASALREVFSGGIELLVFGHIHRPARGRFRDGDREGEYAILPAFDEAGIHLVHHGEHLRYRSLDAGELPDYPSREFH